MLVVVVLLWEPGVNEPTSISVMSSPAGMACISGLSAVTTANCEALMNKFQALSYHDQHSVTAQCVTALLNQMRTFVEGNSSLLPQLQPIAFLLELMQHALNLNGLMSFVVDVRLGYCLLFLSVRFHVVMIFCDCLCYVCVLLSCFGM